MENKKKIKKIFNRNIEHIFKVSLKNMQLKIYLFSLSTLLKEKIQIKRKKGKVQKMLKKEKTKQKTEYKMLHRRNKGITLIALVITIIVLLILAGVSINILIGENGLLTKSQDAADENTRGGARDKVATSVYASYNTDYNPNDLKLKIDEEALKTNIEKAGGKVTSTGGFPVTVEMDGYEFTISEEGNITYNGSESETGGKTELMTFTIDGVEYTCEEGMTWQQFIDSSYNDGKDDRIKIRTYKEGLSGITEDNLFYVTYRDFVYMGTYNVANEKYESAVTDYGETGESYFEGDYLVCDSRSIIVGGSYSCATRSG